MSELFFEVFSEEIPARMQARAAADLERSVCDLLTKAELPFQNAKSFVTPRRLALVINGLPDAQPDVREERRGPRADAPEKAVAGFLSSIGMTRDQCEERETPKGTFLFVTIERKGRPTIDVLKEILPEALSNLPWPKSMRWGDHDLRWVRPLHSIIALFGGTVVPFQFGPIASSNTTRGHRFMAPAEITVSDFADYKDKLRAAKVLVDQEERKAKILADATKLATDVGLTLKSDEGLLNEVSGLVEWPVMLMGNIDASFMEVPKEVLITSMRAHQKYFSCLNADGSLAPRFIVAANKEAPDGGKAITAGNERVLRARLSDAKFFWDQDHKKTLEGRIPALADMVFHAKLGTVKEKVDRITKLAGTLCHYIPGADKALAERAARLCKSDLVSEMVYEFPEVQGIMGRYYALDEGEKPQVANAIADHYSPQGPGDACPSAPESVAVALADKIDTLVGFWAIDEKPTGSKDPFALRRAALGIIRLIIENKLRLPLIKAFSAADYGKGSFDANDLLSFFADRLKVHLKEQGVRHDLVSAVFALGGEDDLVRLLARVDALSGFLESDDGANLLAAYRRASNIVRIEEKKDDQTYDGQVDVSLLVQEEEKALNAALSEVGEKTEPLIKDEKFADAMSAMVHLRGPVDAFFDKVTVNSDEADRRINRLRLLSQIRGTLGGIADFAKIEG